MGRVTIFALLCASALAACSTISNVTTSQVDFSEYPPELPQRTVTDLSSDAQRALRRALDTADRQLSPVCTQRELALIKEGIIIFGWITASSKPDVFVQTYVNARAPVLRREYDNLSPACDARFDALVREIRGTA